MSKSHTSDTFFLHLLTHSKPFNKPPSLFFPFPPPKINADIHILGIINHPKRFTFSRRVLSTTNELLICWFSSYPSTNNPSKPPSVFFPFPPSKINTDLGILKWKYVHPIISAIFWGDIAWKFRLETYPLVIKHSNGKSPINRSLLARKLTDEWSIFHTPCLMTPEGRPYTWHPPLRYDYFCCPQGHSVEATAKRHLAISCIASYVAPRNPRCSRQPWRPWGHGDVNGGCYGTWPFKVSFPMKKLCFSVLNSEFSHEKLWFSVGTLSSYEKMVIYRGNSEFSHENGDLSSLC